MIVRILALLSLFSVALPLGATSYQQPLFVQQIEHTYPAHIDFSTAIYLVEKRKAVRTPCIIQFVEAVKKEVKNPAHNAPFGSERGEQLIAQLKGMYLNSAGRALLADYHDEGRTMFINWLTERLLDSLPEQQQ